MQTHQPGHIPNLCPSCAHRLDPFLPIACGRVRWEQQRHLVPDLQRDEAGVVTCRDYQPAEHATAGDERLGQT